MVRVAKLVHLKKAILSDRWSESNLNVLFFANTCIVKKFSPVATGGNNFFLSVKIYFLIFFLF